MNLGNVSYLDMGKGVTQKVRLKSKELNFNLFFRNMNGSHSHCGGQAEGSNSVVDRSKL